MCIVLVAILPGLGVAAELGRIGVTVTDLGNPFFVRIARGVENAARRIVGPDVRVFVVSSAYDLKRQNDQIDAFISKKVDLIVLIAADPVDIEPAVRRAQAAGIRVVALDVRAAGADATFTTDNVQAGELACQHIVHRLNGIGNVVIISGPAVSSITDRISGCLSVFKAAPGINVLSSDRNGGGSSEGGFAKMTDVLTLFPHVDAVFTINDPTALGVEEAARQAGRKEFFIVSVDGAPKVKARMREADSLIVATVAQMPDLLAQKAVESGYAMIRKRPVANRVVMIPAVLLTRETTTDVNDWAQ
ncbi:MAG TPA: ABC transporter substrate-binding protein [Patescibacteria group bacterium]|nr:ABC transporter substrate-binding protein [Patescibacteria group bacterium]